MSKDNRYDELERNYIHAEHNVLRMDEHRHKQKLGEEYTLWKEWKANNPTNLLVVGNPNFPDNEYAEIIANHLSWFKKHYPSNIKKDSQGLFDLSTLNAGGSNGSNTTI